MLKRPINYTSFDGESRTGIFYFNLTKAECIDMELSTEEGFAAALSGIVATGNAKMIIRVFKDIVLRAYGERSEDGQHFRKSPEISKAFSETAAYDALFMELVTNDKAGADFINGILPLDINTKLNVPVETLKLSETSPGGNIFDKARAVYTVDELQALIQAKIRTANETQYIEDRGE